MSFGLRFSRKLSTVHKPEIGQTVSAKRIFTQDDVDKFSKLSHDLNPLHYDDNFAKMLNFNGPIVHGALLNGTISSLIGTKLPGIGSILLEQDLHFPSPLYVGHEFEAIVKIISKKRSIYICEYECKTILDQKMSNILDNPKNRDILVSIKEILRGNNLSRRRALPPISSDSQFCNSVRDRFSFDCDEVFDNIILGNAFVARNLDYLKDLGITHVLNCAKTNNFNCVSTDEDYYKSTNIKFKGLKIDDVWTENISRFFDTATDFIDDALNNTGKILVHCFAGISRSATIVIAYLMIKRGFTVVDAFRQICQHRDIWPNDGFCKQLVQLEVQLRK